MSLRPRQAAQQRPPGSLSCGGSSHPFRQCGCCTSRRKAFSSRWTTAACTRCSDLPCRSGPMCASPRCSVWTSSRRQGCERKTESSQTGSAACSWRWRVAATPLTPSAGSRRRLTQKRHASVDRCGFTRRGTRSPCYQCSWYTPCFAHECGLSFALGGLSFNSWLSCCRTHRGEPFRPGGCCCTTCWSSPGRPAGYASAHRHVSATRQKLWSR
mmetsp:Transcript_5036/g.14809  ORF Transcript_5036/g.14809 Transcript_5036/m.14809 type:complete len:213 (-) Transcript_5036:387-1025(-)